MTMFDKVKIDQCTITLTRCCNLRCSFCYAKETGYIENDMIEYENLKKIVDFCSVANVNYIVFTGGEPALYPKLIDILKYIKSKDHKMTATIATNGVRLADFNYCKELIENGLGYIDISLKGKDIQECYETVGCDCLSQQLTAIQNLTHFPVEFTCSMVLTWRNINTFCEAIKIAYDNGAKQFSFTFIIDNEDSDEKDLSYLEGHNPLALIESFVSQIDKLNSITKEWWIEYSFPLCFFSDEQLILLDGKLAAPCSIHTGNTITFDTKMNLLPCNMYINSSLGQFGVDFSTYEEFTRYMECELYKSTIDNLNQYPTSNCSTCKYLESCYGGCPIIWKNFSFDAFEEFRSTLHNSTLELN